MYAVSNILNSATDTHAASSISAAVRRVLKNKGFVPDTFITDKLPSYGAALKDLGLAKHHDFGGRKTNMQLSKCRLILTGLFYYVFYSTFWPVAANLTIRDQTESGFILTGAHPCVSLTTDLGRT